METYVNRYKLNQSNKEYILAISLIGNLVKISCKTTIPGKTSDFCREFTLDELKKLDKSFNIIETPLQAIKYIDRTLKSQKIKIIEEGNAIQIKFYFTTKGVLHQLEVPLGQKTTEFNSTQINTQTEDFSQYLNIEQPQIITTSTDEIKTDYNIEQNTGNYELSAFQSTETTQNYENFNQFETQTNEIKYDENMFSIPYITPADELNENKFLQDENITSNIETNVDMNTFENLNLNEVQASQPITEYQNITESKNVEEIIRDVPKSDDRIIKLEGDASTLRNSHINIQNKLNLLSEQVNQYKNKLDTMEKDKLLNELSELRAENMAFKQQLLELKNQKQESPELYLLKSQFNELSLLKSKIFELSSSQDKLKDYSRDMENLRGQIRDLENIKTKYEQEIREFRENQTKIITQKIEEKECKKECKKEEMNEKKNILFEEKAQHFCVKGDIIQNTEELEMLTRKINKFNKKLTLNLIYKATADSDTAEAFHAKCDGAKSTLVLVETDKGRRFGGYTTCDWSGECIGKKDEDAFVFSLDNMKIYDILPGEEAIGCYPNFGPTFMGCQIRIYDNAFTKGGTTFEKGLNYDTQEDYELNEGERTFGVKDIEVYEVIPQ